MSQTGDELEPRGKAGLELVARRAPPSVRSNNIYIPEHNQMAVVKRIRSKHMVVPRECKSEVSHQQQRLWPS